MPGPTGRLLGNAKIHAGCNMIKFRCTGCQKKIGVPEKFAGKRVKCPSCGTALTVPEPEPVLAEPPSGGLNPMELDESALDDLMPKASDPVVAQPEPTAKPRVAPGGGQTCPSCGAICSSQAVLCIQCGTSLVNGQGKKLKTKIKSGVTVDDEATGAQGKPFWMAALAALGVALTCGIMWAVYRRFFDWEIGFMAWGVGLATGGMASVLYRRGGLMMGMTCAVLALSGIFFARGLISVWSYPAFFASQDDKRIEAAIQEDYLNDWHFYMYENAVQWDLHRQGKLSDQEKQYTDFGFMISFAEVGEMWEESMQELENLEQQAELNATERPKTEAELEAEWQAELKAMDDFNIRVQDTWASMDDAARRSMLADYDQVYSQKLTGSGFFTVGVFIAESFLSLMSWIFMILAMITAFGVARRPMADDS